MITGNVRILVLVVMLYAHRAHAMAFSVQSTGHNKIPFVLGLMSDKPELRDIAQIIKKDFEYRSQFAVDIKQLSCRLGKHDIKQLYKDGYHLALFINYVDEATVEWRLYSTHQSTMVKGKKYIKRGPELRAWAHNISDAVWPVVTNTPGFFSTKIAYCKEVPLSTGHHYKHIYVADYDGSNAQPLVTSSTISVAPRWNRDGEYPIVFYSECTTSNIRLMATDMKKRRKIVSNFDGLNMLPAFSRDGTKVVYCASRGDGCCQLYYYEKGVFRRLTHNNGNNISPVFSENADKVFFCSDFQTGMPQIFCYDLVTDVFERLTDSGYCASPAYCASKQMLAYTKIVKGVSQIFLYNLVSKEHKQVTFDASNKEECSWSVCGTYLAHSVQEGISNRIALYDLITNERRFITPASERCSYPAWSPIYTDFPLVT